MTKTKFSERRLPYVQDTRRNADTQVFWQKSLKLILCSGCASFALLALPAAAQDQSAANNEDTQRAFIDEVIVTASKREQSLLEAPLAVQSFGGGMLEDSNIRDLSELITFVPGASEGFSRTIGKRQFNLRGTGGTDGDATTGYYIGETPFKILGTGFAPSARSFDMERVEVLRGPQGTLYGNSALGGVVRYIPNKPNSHGFEVHSRSGYQGVDGGDAGYYSD